MGQVQRIRATINSKPGTVEHFMQFVSLDTWGKQAEYIRHGLDFDLAINRCEEFITDVPERSSLTFIITMNNLSIVSLKQLLEHILYLRKDPHYYISKDLV
jgi:hypothetical protein